MKLMAVLLVFTLFEMPLEASETKNRGKRSYDIADADYVSFTQNVFFNTLGKGIPFGSILSNVITLFRSGSGKKPLFDQIKEKIQREIIKGVSEFHKEDLLARIKAHHNSLFMLTNHTLQFEPEKFLNEMIEERKAIFREKHFFFPNTFEKSIGYDPNIINCFAPITMMYMSLSYEIENYYYRNNLPRNGSFKTNLQERKDFLEDVSSAALETMNWALNKRESLITYEKSTGLLPQYYAYDETTNDRQTSNTVKVWTKQRELFEVDVGNYAILAHKVRKIAKHLVQEVVFDPVNKFLKNEYLPLIKNYVDKKINYPRTMSGEPCRTPCINQSSNYWWCGIEKVTYSKDWDYCSPTYDNVQRTIKDEECLSNCTNFICKTKLSSEKCSSESAVEDLASLTWPTHHGFTIYGVKCFSGCQKHEDYWFCYTSERGSWDYCSPPKDPQSTYLGKECKSDCTFSKNVWSKSYYYCNTFDSWDYCSPIFHTESVPSPCSSDDCLVIDFNLGDKLAENDDWYFAYKFRQYILKGEKYVSKAATDNVFWVMMSSSTFNAQINPYGR